MVTRSVQNGLKKCSEWGEGRLFLPFAYAQTTVRVYPNDRLRRRKFKTLKESLGEQGEVDAPVAPDMASVGF